jgi:hypothetical protein
MSKKIPDRLPADWLPEPVAPASGDAAAWQHRLDRLMSVAEPTLAELARTATSPGPACRPAAPSWWQLLAARWRPALSAAALAAAALLLALRLLPVTPATSTPTAFALTAVAGAGEPAALWQAMGAEAEPTLARIVLQGGSQ